MKIDIKFEGVKKTAQYQPLIKQEVKRFFKDLKINPEAVVNFTFITPKKIQILNKKYRHQNQPTDVLSFPIWQNLSQIPKTGVVNLGDIFICPEAVAENAKKSKIDFEIERNKIIQHSLNHLIGKHH